MDANEDYTSQFKNTIEKIVNAEIDKRGITKYVSAIVKDVNEDGTINVYIPPNLNSVINGLLNKTGETLSAGDSVELCTKNGYINNAWVSIKHKTNNSGTQGGGIPTGGTTGQILTKKSNTDYDTEWSDGEYLGAITGNAKSGNNDYTISNTWTKYEIPITSVNRNLSEFELENGELVYKGTIAKKVLLSANALFKETGANSKTFGIWFTKSNGSVIYYESYSVSSNTAYITASLAPFLLEIQPGDKLSLGMRFGATGTASVNGEGTYLTIQECTPVITSGNVDEALFYKSGDAFVCDYDTIMNGYITSGTKNVRVSLPVPKRLDNISSITVESLNVEGRCNKGYLNSQSGNVEYVGKSGYTVEANKSNNNVVNILISKSSVWSNVDNNTLVSLVAYVGNLKLVFN